MPIDIDGDGGDDGLGNDVIGGDGDTGNSNTLATLLTKPKSTTASLGLSSLQLNTDIAINSNIDIDVDTTCIDDPAFLWKGKKRDCGWVRSGKNEQKKKKRCNKIIVDHENDNPQHPQQQPQKIENRCQWTCNYQKCNKLTVGVYYYPWWNDDFHGGRYMRNQLSEPNKQIPKLGEHYNDTESKVIDKHVRWSNKYNINLWVTSWWGEGRKEDITLKSHILTNPHFNGTSTKKKNPLQFAIFYETTGRIRQRDNYALDNVVDDIQYLCKEYFHRPNYYTINGRPVLFVYLTRKLETLNLLSTVIEKMRFGVVNSTEGGCNTINDIYILGDQVFQRPPKPNELDEEQELIPFKQLDGITNYDVYGSMGGEGGYAKNEKTVIDYYARDQHGWKEVASKFNCAFIPCVSPGYNDRGVRPEVQRIPLSRKLNSTAEEGSLFTIALQEAKKLVDSNTNNLIMVNSFNEWHEDTQIEPCVKASSSATSTTNEPFDLTNGLDYDAYGNLYLQILKQETKSYIVSQRTPALTSSYLNTVVSSATTTVATAIIEIEENERNIDIVAGTYSDILIV